MLKFCITFFCISFFAPSFHAQDKVADSAEFAHFDCEITQTKQKLDRRFFASVPAIRIRINNEEQMYASLHLGKRKNKMYLYLKLLADNICIKKDKNVDLHFKTGEILTLKNEYPINCESLFVKQLTKKELKKLRENELTFLQIYTYKKNYEMYLNDVQNQDIHQYIDCLSAYKIKKTNEVKPEKNK
ncbi:hypothetical protein [Chryseobacterium salviniae]|uniref:Uncharacterized protein n=1 Tax=Chryseobacterium salviniae TaxID=3101750 RepID=A0ABU6HM95_9FLAO|nr:hypothetical protein [Chryseobacterium sp. T9W2-O]MEC3874187.1 hypothetical protein [Chryseobacterium sp. T9W2-O]